MRWLIRRVVKKGKGSVAYEEDIHYGDVLTIGRGSDQAIFLSDLRVALEHAKITAVSGSQYKIESLILAGIRVNNDITYATTVGPGAILEIGTTRLQLLEPTADFDAAVELTTIDKAELKAAKEAKARPTSLAKTWLSKRLPAWALFTLIALLFVALPMLAHFSTGFGSTLQKLPLPSQDSWQAGELAAAHHYFGSQCTLCHEKAFRWVRDDACGRCHGGLAAHADPVKFNLPELGDARCAHCHRDHNGIDGLVIRDQILCDDCHSNLKARTANASTLNDIADFGTEHSEFQIDLPNWDANGVFAPQRATLGTPGIKERSGLKFPHDVHLRAEGLNSPGGKKVLDCLSCHAPDAGGATMKPVDFETMCQDCHRLDFDVLEPGRQVPHAKIEEILYTLDEFYAKRGLEGGYADVTSPAIVQQRRRPGQPLSRQEQIEALAWARQKARTVGESLFTGRACSVCHAVSPGRRADEPWRVAPVRVAGVWFSKAHFTHASHTVGVTCRDCHEAEKSTESGDLLILGVESCRGCHGGENVANKVPSTCVMCHGYHESSFLVLAELQARAKGAAPPTPAATPAATPAPAATGGAR